MLQSQNCEKENSQVNNLLIKELEDKIEFLKSKNETIVQDLNKTAESRIEEFEKISKQLDEKLKQLEIENKNLV